MLKTNKIFLENINRSLHGEQYIGNNSRLSTCTGVKIIDDNHLVTTHFVGQKMYLFEFSGNADNFSYKLLDTIDTTLNHQMITTDLLDYNDGRIMTSNCEHACTSLYTVDKTTWKLQKVRDYEENNMGFCHGTKFYPHDKDLFVAMSYKPSYCIYFKSLKTNKIQLRIDCKPRLPKDVCFPSENTIIAIFCERFPAKHAGVFYCVDVNYYSFNLNEHTYKILDHIRIEKCHTDSCVFSQKDQKLYFTGGVDNTVIVYKLENSKLTFSEKIVGFSSPHGIDIHQTDNKMLLAVSNYGDNSVSLRYISSL
jgi:hypothetical protein